MATGGGLYLTAIFATCLALIALFSLGHLELTFNLKTSGAAVTGTIDGLPTEASEIKEGKVDGDSITFWSMTEYQGSPIKLVYHGKIAGDQISFTMGTDDGGWSADLVAKRSS